MAPAAAPVAAGGPVIARVVAALPALLLAAVPLAAQAAPPLAAPAAQVQAAITRLQTPRGRATVTAALRRAAPLAGMVQAKLAAWELPAALIYLPVVESGYLPTATSRAGARGVWQLMPRTARALGLRVDAWVDARLDPWAATDAACRHLRDLVRVAQGDWTVALAAYNAGAGRVTRAGATRAGYWAVQGALPAETRAYVPQLLALVAVGRAPAAYGLGGVPRVTGAPPPWGRVWAEAGVPLATVAAARGVPEATVVALNPQYLRRQLPPDAGGWVVVPLPANDVLSPEPTPTDGSVGARSALWPADGPTGRRAVGASFRRGHRADGGDPGLRWEGALATIR